MMDDVEKNCKQTFFLNSYQVGPSTRRPKGVKHVGVVSDIAKVGWNVYLINQMQDQAIKQMKLLPSISDCL